MSIHHFNTDLLKLLQLHSSNHNFFPVPYKGTDSCIKDVSSKGITSTYVNLVSHTHSIDCPHCGCFNHHHSKGLRSLKLTHVSLSTHKTILDISYRRFVCADCGKYFKEPIPFKFDHMLISKVAAMSALKSFSENTAISVISREHGFSKSSMYRLFSNHISIPPRYYQLAPVISVDEFKATTGEGVYAFHITNPITGKTIDILEDRKYATIRNHFVKCEMKERKKVKIIIMDLSSSFLSTMKSLFPNALIIADKFHYVRIVRNNMVQARIACSKQLKNESLRKLIKKHLHLFDQYKERLREDRARYIPYFKKHMTNKQLIEAILEVDECQILKEGYQIYQRFLSLLHTPNIAYKEKLNEWLDYIFETENEYFIGSAKNFRKKWFVPILRSLTHKATYIRKGKKYQTSYNNGFIESMNNKVKLVKRNAYGFRYFHNLRKRILMHLGFSYKIT